MPIFLPNVLTRCTVFTSAFWSSVLGQNIGVLRLSLLANIYTRGSHQTENHFQEQIVFNDHQRLDSYSAQVVCKNILGTCNVSSFQQNNFFFNPDPTTTALFMFHLLGDVLNNIFSLWIRTCLILQNQKKMFYRKECCFQLQIVCAC